MKATHIGIFATPISIIKLNKDKISAELDKIDLYSIVERIGENSVNSHWKCNCFTSHKENKIFHEDPWVQTFLEECSRAINDYINSIKFNNDDVLQFHMDVPWVNLYTKGDYQEVHHHISSKNIISYAYMHKLPKNSGNLYFTKGNESNLYLGQDDLVVETAPRNRFAPIVDEGDLVIFPSYLQHFVEPNRSDETRVTISGNVKNMKRIK